MIFSTNLFYGVYSYLATLEEVRGRRFNWFLLLVIKLMKKFCTLMTIFLTYLVCWRRKRMLVDENSEVIVSLTSFPARINTVWLTIVSLGNQLVKSKKIILYLSLNEFPNKQEDLPASIKNLQKFGLSVEFVKDNLKSHKKYFYSFQAFPEDIIITVDDDLLYPSDTISRLLALSKQFPDEVIANRSSRIVIDNNEISSYTNWEPCFNPACDKYLVAIGCGGVLYPTSFRPEVLFNVDLIRQLAPLADDLWLKSVQLLHGVRVVQGAFFSHPMTIPRTHKSSLMQVNVQSLKLNDRQFKELDNHFNLKRFLI